MKKIVWQMIFFASCILIAGCAHSPRKTMENITFEEGMRQLAAGLKTFEQTNRHDKQQVFGLVPAEIEATFNMNVIKKNTGETALVIDPTHAIKEFTSLTKTWKYEASESRGNTIKIKFRNVLFAQKNEFIYDKNPKELLKSLENFHIAKTSTVAENAQHA